MIGIEYCNIVVSAQNLTGTMMQCDVRCSTQMYRSFLNFCDNGFGRHDFVRASKILAILWVENYHEGAEWRMNDSETEWDDALKKLMDRVIGYRT